MICGHMHVYQVNNWADIIEQQLYRIKKSGLYDRMNKLYIGLLGDKPARQFSKKIEIIYQLNQPSLEQSFTLTHLHLSSYMFNGQIFYIHTKGVSHNSGKEDDNQKDWRKLMEHYIIDRWKTCVSELEKNDVVGVNWHLGEGHMNAKAKYAEGTPITPHVSGNFWWATTDYIKRLPILFPLKSKYECEFWIGKTVPKVAELWRTGIHHHRNPYPESEYIGKIKARYYYGREIRHINA